MDLAEPETLVRLSLRLPAEVLVLHSIPPVPSGASGELRDPTPQLLEALGQRPARMVYLSTTGIYGNQPLVDENSPVAPRLPTHFLRLAAERLVQAGPWPGLVLRPAGIYGPGRGVHIRIKNGTYKLGGDGHNYLSRIYVDDLAAHCEAGLLADRDVTGAYPVADERPATSLEMATFCAGLLGLPLPPSIPFEELPATLQANRKVDGRTIRQLLGVKLAYPSYREGIPAALAAEGD
jgi:nucleoside-diphosphate-sugar epimerase